MASRHTFPIRYGVFRPLLSLLGMGPRFSSVEVEGDRVRVRMGWSFQADIPRSSITGAEASTGFGGIGVHGGRGQWLVNGAAKGLVTISIRPPEAGCCGCRYGSGPCGSASSRPRRSSPS